MLLQDDKIFLVCSDCASSARATTVSLKSMREVARFCISGKIRAVASHPTFSLVGKYQSQSVLSLFFLTFYCIISYNQLCQTYFMGTHYKSETNTDTHLHTHTHTHTQSYIHTNALEP